MASVERVLQAFLDQHSHINRWLVAYSGGLDSSVLLRAMVALKPSQPIVALHVHHGLSAHADAWQQHCQQTCDRLGVSLQVHAVDVRNAGGGLEEAAREARYRVFESVLQSGDGLLMAHHQDDQAETMLLRLMRGSGPRGLAAMATSRALSQGWLYRPLLELPRQVLEKQARDWSMTWVEDDSNLSQAFDRNYLRHAVLPAIRERWPQFAAQWQQSADWCREADGVVNDVAKLDWQAADWRRERCGSSLSLSVLQQLTPFRRGNVLRYWMQMQGNSMPQRIHLEEVEAQLMAGREDSEAKVSWGQVQLRRYRQRLFCLPLKDGLPQGATFNGWTESMAAPVEPQSWNGATPLAWGGGRLTLLPVAEGGFRWPDEGFRVACRQGGERCQPHWRQNSQTLKKLLQEVGLEPWLRQQVPLLYHGQDLAVVGDLWVCRGWLAEAGETGYRLQWDWGNRP